jgi:hypothetical protein
MIMQGQRVSVAIRVLASLAICFILIPFPAIAANTLIPQGSTWSYLDDGSNQGSAWRTPTFDDSQWASGPAQLGYGDGDEATVVSYGPSSGNKYVTTYFRHHFQVSDPGQYNSLTFRLLRDDGAVVYLNGQEVLRSNMPGGSINYLTTASSTVGGSDEDTFFATTLSTAGLLNGDNVLAVEVHQRGGASSDISFDLELMGNLGSGAVSVTRGPYLQMGTSDSVVVRWRTDVAADSRVRFGTDLADLNSVSDDIAATTEHEVRVTGLNPKTRYYYSIGTAAETLSGGDDETYFETSPLSGTAIPTRIWIIGDSGTANANARRVYDAYLNQTGGDYTDLWLMLGDNAYSNGTDDEYQRAVFDMYSQLLRQTVLWPTLGNHDGHTADSASESGPYYDIFTLPRQGEAGGLASGTEAYYSFDYGKIHFIVLDSYETNRSVSGAMLSWMQADLQSATADWIIAFWHHPPYSKGSHNSDTESNLIDMRENALPILEDYGVDLVLSGHSHSYERSMLIDGHYGPSATFDPGIHARDVGSGRVDDTGAYAKMAFGAAHAGTVYAVAGSSGQTSGGSLDHPAMYLSFNELGSMVLEVDGLILNARFIDDAGVARDYFTIDKSWAPLPPANLSIVSDDSPAGSGLFSLEPFRTLQASDTVTVQAAPVLGQQAEPVTSVYDADIDGDEELASNGSAPVTAIGEQASGASDNRAADVNLSTPAAWWTRGPNQLRFKRITTHGFRVNDASVSFLSNGQTGSDETRIVDLRQGLDGHSGTEDTHVASGKWDNNRREFRRAGGWQGRLERAPGEPAQMGCQSSSILRRCR